MQNLRRFIRRTSFFKKMVLSVGLPIPAIGRSLHPDGRPVTEIA
jgi:hypothetical protein